MMRTRGRWAAAPLLAAALWLGACSDQVATGSRLVGPSQMAGAKGGSNGSARSAVRAVQGGVPADSVIRADSAIIQGSGRLYVAGNELFVPGGAVKAPTMFKMRLKENGTVGVELRAFQQDASGNWTVDVGAEGFRRPLQLTLGYEFIAENGINVNQLLVAWAVSPTDLRPVGSRVVKTTQDVYSELLHFSDYILAVP